MKEKDENRKALPKYLGTLLVAGLIGGVLGALSMGASLLVREHEAVDLSIMLESVAVVALPLSALVLLGAGACLYRAAKAAFRSWDGEEEAVMERAEERLNWALLLDTLSMILGFFCFSAGTVRLMQGELFAAILVMVEFVIAVAFAVFLQQRVVDLTREMNPEKHGSVYDKNFRKVWWESCDEAERRQIGQASYKAFTTMNIFCPVLWGILFFGNLIFGIGILPGAVVLLLWAVGQVSYTVESIRLSRHGDR